MEDFPRDSVRCLEDSPEYWMDIPEGKYPEPLTAQEFTDDSGKLFIGRFFDKDSIVKWLEKQPTPNWVNFICVHHTWSPTPSNWYGLKSLYGIFDYYHYERGWPVGKGPHGWVAPEYHGGSWGAFIGTNPFHVGIGATEWNYDTIHIENIWNGDVSPFSNELKIALVDFIRPIAEWAGVPLQRVLFDSDGFANKKRSGFIYHRHTRKANKSCPGTKVPNSMLEELFEMVKGGSDLTKEENVLLTKLWIGNIARSYDAEVSFNLQCASLESDSAKKQAFVNTALEMRKKKEAMIAKLKDVNDIPLGEEI